MNVSKKQLFKALFLSGAVALTAPAIVMAATPACTSIVNTAHVTYNVGGVTQTPPPDASTSFVVGNKVKVKVTTTDLVPVSVIPGDTDKSLGFRVTNEGNANQKYVLTMPAQPAGGVVLTATDNKNVTAGFGINALGTATITTATILPGDYLEFTVHAAIPLTLVDADAAALGLIATTYKTDGTTIEAEGSGTAVSTAGSCTADIVFADTVDGSDDPVTGRKGDDSARSIFKVLSASLTFSKGTTTLWDPINGSVSPKAIPDALIQYDIKITNAPGAGNSARLDLITDTLVANLTLDPDFRTPLTATPCPALPATCTLAANVPVGDGGAGKGFKVVSTGTTRSSTSNYYSTAVADSVDITGQAITADMKTALPVDGATYPNLGQLNPGESVTLFFNVVIN